MWPSPPTMTTTEVVRNPTWTQSQHQNMSEVQQRVDEVQPAPGACARRQVQQQESTPQIECVQQYSFDAQQSNLQFQCLYSKQKTQKRKKWNDGRLKLNGIRAVLHDANPAPGSGDPPIDECEVSSSQIALLLRGQEHRVETDKHLIQVEGPWVSPPPSSFLTNHPKAVVSRSMHKLVQNKFRKPPNYIPPKSSANPSSKQETRLRNILGKRRRPLQPGELERRHYGMEQSSTSSTLGNPPQPSEKTSTPIRGSDHTSSRLSSTILDEKRNVNRDHHQMHQHSFRRYEEGTENWMPMDASRNSHVPDGLATRRNIYRDQQTHQQSFRRQEGETGRFRPTDAEQNSDLNERLDLARPLPRTGAGHSEQEPDQFFADLNYGKRSKLQSTATGKAENAFVEPSGFDATNFYGYEEAVDLPVSTACIDAEPRAGVPQSRPSTLSGSQILALFSSSPPKSRQSNSRHDTDPSPSNDSEGGKRQELHSDFILPSPSSTDSSSSDESEK